MTFGIFFLTKKINFDPGPLSVHLIKIMAEHLGKKIYFTNILTIIPVSFFQLTFP